MRKFFNVVFFLSLLAVAGFSLWKTYESRTNPTATADKRTVMGILDRKPITADIPDNVLVKAAEKIEPAVVNIDVAGERHATGVNIFGETMERSYILQGKGSGVIISPDGYVVTNNHVVEGANIIRISLANGTKYEGHVVGADQDADLAVVKIEAKNLIAAEIGDSGKLKVGEYVIAIGNPLGVGTTVTHGIISATNRKNLTVGEGRVLRQALQTDAPINRGNSGGALANTAGQLIGINTAIASEKGGGNIGIGFAIPINVARIIVKDLIANGRAFAGAPSEPFIGIAYNSLPPAAAQQFGLKPGEGILIQEVRPLTPAEDAGLKQGDIIVGIDHKVITSLDNVRTALSRHKIGDKILFLMLRGDGSRNEVSVTIGKKPASTNTSG